MSGTLVPHDGRTTASHTARRNAAMAARKAAGATWDEIALEFGCAKSTARKGMADHRAATAAAAELPGDRLRVDPAAVVAEALDAYRWALGELRGMARLADNDSARVGAVRAAVAVVDGRLDLLARVGYLPSDLGQMGDLLDLREIAEAMVTAVDDFGARIAGLKLAPREEAEARAAAQAVHACFAQFADPERAA